MTQPGPSILDRLSARQAEILREIATGHVSFAEYPRSGRVYMGPSLVFDADDVKALEEAGLITTGHPPRITAGGREALSEPSSSEEDA